MDLSSCFEGLVIDTPVYLSITTTLGLIVLSGWIVRHEPFSGRRHFLATLLGMIWWLALATMEMSTPLLDCKIAAALATWPAISLVPVSWCFFMLHFCFGAPIAWRSHETTIILVIVACVSAVAFSNPWHGFFYDSASVLKMDGFRPYVEFVHGPLFYVTTAFLYIFLMAGLVIATIAAFQASRSLRPIMMMMMFATAAPMVANFGYVTIGVSVFGFDPTPFAFAFVLMVLTWVIYSSRSFDLSMMARDLLYFNLVDPVVVVDVKRKLAGVNPAADKLMPQLVLGAPLDPCGPLDFVTSVLSKGSKHPDQAEIVVGERIFNMKVVPILRPLGEAGSNLGAVAIMSDVTQLKTKNAELVAALEQSRAQVAEITRLRELAEHSAMSDALTGIGNLRSLQLRIETLGDSPVSLALIDLDRFKEINDRLGHAVGDRVLQDFTNKVCQILPRTAELFRVGGEEFLLLGPGMTSSELLTLLAHLRQEIIDNPPLREHDHARLTFSAGVATRSDGDATYDELYAGADARLYKAKNMGRDKILYIGDQSF